MEYLSLLRASLDVIDQLPLDDLVPFVRSIVENRSDKAPPGIFADWLEDRGISSAAQALRKCADHSGTSWANTWRRGFVSVISTKSLDLLFDALIIDDSRLVQGSTTTPPPLAAVQDWPCEASDALAFCGWIGENLTTVGEVEEYYARACYECDQRMGEPAACRWFMNWYDDTPRLEMLEDLACEVFLVLLTRLVNIEYYLRNKTHLISL